MPFPRQGGYPVSHLFERAPMSFALALASVSFLLAVVWGRPLISELRRRHVGKQIRIEGPSTHLIKTGTPTMGGIMILVPVFIVTVVLNFANLMSGLAWGKTVLRLFNFSEGSPLIGKSILLPLFVLVSFGYLGARDDLKGVREKRSDGQGLVARAKASYQIILAFLTAAGMYFLLGLHSVALPGVPEKINIGLIYIPIAVFFIVGFSNAVNLTDGLDGLAGVYFGSSFCRLRRHRLFAGPVSTDVVLFRHGRRSFRLPLVQLLSGRVVHGRHGCARLGCHAGGRSADDWPVATVACRRRRVRGRNALKHAPGGLFQVDKASLWARPPDI